MKYYEVFFNNLNCGRESAILGVSDDATVNDDMMENLLDDFLSGNCYCDGYEYRRYKALTPKQSKLFDDIFYECRDLYELADDFTKKIDDSYAINPTIYYHANCIYCSAKKYTKR